MASQCPVSSGLAPVSISPAHPFLCGFHPFGRGTLGIYCFPQESWHCGLNWLVQSQGDPAPDPSHRLPISECALTSAQRPCASACMVSPKTQQAWLLPFPPGALLGLQSCIFKGRVQSPPRGYISTGLIFKDSPCSWGPAQQTQSICGFHVCPL